MPNSIMRWFDYRHLPLGSAGRESSALVHDLAVIIDDAMPESAEKSAGLRKLLEAKDCFVRAAIQNAESPGATDPAPLLGTGYTSVGGLYHSHGKGEHSHEGGAEPHYHRDGKVVPL